MRQRWTAIPQACVSLQYSFNKKTPPLAEGQRRGKTKDRFQGTTGRFGLRITRYELRLKSSLEHKAGLAIAGLVHMATCAIAELEQTTAVVRPGLADRPFVVVAILVDDAHMAAAALAQCGQVVQTIL